MLPLDTSPDVHAAQLRWLERLGPAGRVELMVRRSQEIRDVAAAGIAARHPEYTPAQVRWALYQNIHGDELFRRAWPRAPILDP